MKKIKKAAVKYVNNCLLLCRSRILLYVIMKWSELKRKLKREGFVFLRQAKGSHEVWHHPDRQNSELILCNHPSQEVGTGLANKLLKQAQVK